MTIITLSAQTAAEIIRDLDNAQRALLNNDMPSEEKYQLAARCGVARTFMQCAIEREAVNYARH
jgi:hypothetical protein